MEGSSERDILERVFRLEQENHRILKLLRNAHRWGIFWGFLKFLLIVGPLVLGYFYLEPYLDTLWKTYSQIQGQVNSIQKVTGELGGQIPDIGGLLKQLETLKPR